MHHRQKKDMHDMMAAMEHEFSEAENDARQVRRHRIATSPPGPISTVIPVVFVHKYGCVSGWGTGTLELSVERAVVLQWGYQAR